VRKIVESWVHESAVDDPRDQDLARIAAEFRRDARGAARAFYRELRAGVASAWPPEAVRRPRSVEAGKR
jgi:hypothetical protein